MRLWIQWPSFTASRTPATVLSRVADPPPNKAPSPGSSHQQSAALMLIETVEKRLERRRELKRKKAERGRKGGGGGCKRQTRCVFCLDLNGAERKGVGVRRRAREEEKERGKASGSEWISSFFFLGRTVMKPKHS